MLRSLIFLLSSLGLLGLGACSSFKRSQTIVETEFLVPFAHNPEMGVVIHPVHWGVEVSQDNPGVDCTLSLEKEGPPENLFSCQVVTKNVLTQVRIFEKQEAFEKKRGLLRIVMESQTAGVRNRWVEVLKLSKEFSEAKAEFLPSNSNALPDKSKKPYAVFESKDKETRIEILWRESDHKVQLKVFPLKEIKKL